jgi:hypothetical protein
VFCSLLSVAFRALYFLACACIVVAIGFSCIFVAMAFGAGNAGLRILVFVRTAVVKTKRQTPQKKGEKGKECTLTLAT